METTDWLEGQFDRAVEIVQGLSKTGPIQTGYDEKLAMYSLYKQATVGNVPSLRPGLWDVLGRAKWDAWAKQKDLDQRDAKQQYVETLQKVLRKYSDRTVARDLVRELDSYRITDAAESDDLEQPRTSSSSSSRAASPLAEPYPSDELATELQQSMSTTQYVDVSQPSEAELDYDQYSAAVSHFAPSARPVSSMSSQRRYRTPMAPSVAFPMSDRTSSPALPPVQPIPRYATPSAFGQPPSTSSQPISSATSVGQGPGAVAPSTTYPPYPFPYQHMRQQPMIPSSSSASYPPGSIPQRPPLERALESMQASLAALHERLESIESGSGRKVSPVALPARRNSRALPNVGAPWEWGTDGLGAWSLLLTPLSRLLKTIQTSFTFIVENEAFRRSPVLAIARRLVLDLSFLLFVAAIVRAIWTRSGLSPRHLKWLVGNVWSRFRGKPRGPRSLVNVSVQA